MKKIFVALALLISAGAHAEKTLISEKLVTLSIDVSTAKVKLSRADYSEAVVKVLVPGLAEVTVLDHRNTGEGAPCLATYDTMNPQDVIQGKPDREEVSASIRLEKDAVLDQRTGVCSIYLYEFVETNIRGFAFTHSKFVKIGERVAEDCR